MVGSEGARAGLSGSTPHRHAFEADLQAMARLRPRTRLEARPPSRPQKHGTRALLTLRGGASDLRRRGGGYKCEKNAP
jgi:hypothetical protein